MEALSILDIPDYKKKEYAKNKIGLHIDYKRFNIKSRKILDNLLLNAFRANDTDNSNVVYDGQIAFMRVNSPRGTAHKVIMSVENIGPVPFAYIEVYGLGQGLQGSVAKIDFYGAFFHFIDVIPKRYLQLYSYLMGLSVNEPHVCRITRVDIAMDFAVDFPQNGGSWIKPCKNSQRDVSSYRHHGRYNSYGYLSNKNTGYGVRIYNKLVDICKPSSNKMSWYGGSENLPKKWMRIEYEFYPPYSLMDDYELIKLCWEKTIGYGKVELGLKFRPCYTFKVESAYTYFARYARNHGITLEKLIDEILAHHIKLEILSQNEVGQIEENL